MLKVGIIGAGSMMQTHARRLTETQEVEISAIAEPDPDSARRFAAGTGLNPRAYTDFRQMLRDEPLDCVLVGSPHAFHAEHIVASLQSGRHVLTEKPMANTAAEAQQILAAARDSGRVFMIAYQRHLDPRFRYVEQQLSQGGLGRLTYISAVLLQEWLYTAAGTWRQDPALSGGGQLHDSGSHFVDVLRWIGGPGAEVHAFLDNRGVRVDINSAVNLRFESGALGSLAVVGDAHAYWEDWSFSAERGTILLRNGRLLSLQLGSPPREIGPEELPPGVDVDRAFVDAVLGRSPVPVPGEVGLEVINLTECIWRSAAEGRPVRVPNLTRA